MGQLHSFLQLIPSRQQHSELFSADYSIAITMHDPPDTKAIILISGEGTNLQALIDASSSTMPYLKIKVRK
jgi:hypothetical protein